MVENRWFVNSFAVDIWARHFVLNRETNELGLYLCRSHGVIADKVLKIGLSNPPLRSISVIRPETFRNYLFHVRVFFYTHAVDVFPLYVPENERPIISEYLSWNLLATGQEFDPFI
jgi:hypothetical protein